MTNSPIGIGAREVKKTKTIATIPGTKIAAGESGGWKPAAMARPNAAGGTGTRPMRTPTGSTATLGNSCAETMPIEQHDAATVDLPTVAICTNYLASAIRLSAECELGRGFFYCIKTSNLHLLSALYSNFFAFFR